MKKSECGHPSEVLDFVLQYTMLRSLIVMYVCIYVCMYVCMYVCTLYKTMCEYGTTLVHASKWQYDLKSCRSLFCIFISTHDVIEVIQVTSNS